uniref:Ig-like domain-containing protein n=1 Tax=Junco hyemalis TaxID=40217 RepID=A0A8C5NJ77_JUNHY
MLSHICLTWLLLVLLTGSTVSESIVIGEVGQDITVPCRYSVWNRDSITSMCWGRGSCPNSKCSRPIIWTDGWRVTEQHSSRYQLKGDLHRGDVSLTIVDARESDSGTYCCRVEVPGWFNDQRINRKVVVRKEYFYNIKKMGGSAGLVAFQRPRGMGSHSALEEENPAEENVYIMD